MKPWLLPVIFMVTLIGGATTFTVTTARPAPEPMAVKTDPQLPAFEAEVPLPMVERGPKVAFKWQDERGAWHYADEPPAHAPSQAVTLGPAAPLPDRPADVLLQDGASTIAKPES